MLLVAMATVVFSGFAAQTAAAAGTVDVSVGYADTLRANPANFPTPWSGDPGIVFQGCKANCTWDAGAVRIANNTFITQRVDHVVVKVGACTFDIWPHPTNLAPGQQLIDTQLVANPSGGCLTDGNFDTSDLGPSDTPCTPDGVIPEVDVTLNGTTTAYHDTGQVLNTGGVDRAVCPFGTNEAIQWTPIGHSQCPGSALVLSPASQSHAIGENATVNGTFVNGCGIGLQGAKVVFFVLSGPNKGKTETVSTNSSGVASFTYSSVLTGTDVWWAGISNPAGTIFANNTASVTWTPVTYTGRAFAASLQLGSGSPTRFSDTGDISTMATTNTSRSLVSIPGPPLSASVLSAGVRTGSAKSQAAAGVANATVALPGAPAIVATGVATSSTSSCTGASGKTTIASLTIGGKGIDVSSLKPNTSISAGPLTITLNEQKPVAGADHGLTVNAIHVTLTGVADVIIASSRSDIHGC